MGKFNKRDQNDQENLNNKRARFQNDLDENLSTMDGKIDWQSLVSSFKGKSVEEILDKLINDLCDSNNTDFDQMCLLLKHYLINDEKNQDFLNHFLGFNNCYYVNRLIEKFNLNQHQTNLKWMISELFKILSSISNEEQTNLLLSSQMFSNLLFVSIFNDTILNKMKSEISLSITESAILVNILDSISSLCEIRKDIASMLNETHVNWLANAILCKKNSSDLNTAIAHIFNIFAENSFNANSSNAKQMVQLFFVDSFLKTSTDHLSNVQHVHHHVHNHNQIQSPELLRERSISSNLNSKLYLVCKYTNQIILIIFMHLLKKKRSKLIFYFS